MTHTPIASILAAVRSVPVPPSPIPKAYAPPPAPFVTISREPGAGAIDVGRAFVDAMNQDALEDQAWTCWERELVEKVAADHHLSTRLIEELEENNHSWISSFFSSLSFTDSVAHDEDAIYHKVKRTIEALASAGRVVIIGRGGVFITRHLRGGIHLRLVAPFKDRVAFIAEKMHLTERAAGMQIREWERHRRQFFKMHWPHETVDPEHFAVTINTAEVQHEQIVQMLRGLVRQRIAAASVALGK